MNAFFSFLGKNFFQFLRRACFSREDVAIFEVIRFLRLYLTTSPGRRLLLLAINRPWLPKSPACTYSIGLLYSLLLEALTLGCPYRTVSFVDLPIHTPPRRPLIRCTLFPGPPILPYPLLFTHTPILVPRTPLGHIKHGTAFC